MSSTYHHHYHISVIIIIFNFYWEDLTFFFFPILHFDELREKKKDNKVPRVESEWKLEISEIL